MHALDYFSFGHPLASIRSHFALRARRRMFELFMKWAGPNSEDRILDLGVTPDVSLPESNYFERHYPYREQIVAASIEDASNLEDVFVGIKFQLISGQRLPFPDKAFKYLFCSAVIEHVGSREEQRAFMGEVARVSERFFLTTPNRWFPIEFHTILPLIHWLPQKAHHWLLRRLGMGRWADISMLNLLSDADLRRLQPNGARIAIAKIRLAGLPSNLVVLGEAE